MNKRERMLAIIVGVLLVIVVCFYLWDFLSGTFRQRRNAMATLDKQIDDRELVQRREQRAEARIQSYLARSLPMEREIALGLYQEWLLDLVDEVGLENPNVDGQPPRPKGDIYWQLSFRLGGEGTLDQLASLLHRFYSANHLHRIGNMIVKPVRDTKRFTVDLRVEALVLNGAEDLRTLRTDPSDRLALKSHAEYGDSILARNVFGPANTAPQLERIGSRDASRGETVRLRVRAADPESDRLTYRLIEQGAQDAEIDPTSGEFRWQPGELGTFEFTVEVSDEGQPALTDQQTFRLTVIEPRPLEREDDRVDAEFTFVTAITEGERRLVWLLHRTSGESFQLEEGDTFRAGQLRGSVGKIGLREAHLVLGERTVRVAVGKSLSEGNEVPGDATGAAVGTTPTSRLGG